MKEDSHLIKQVVHTLRKYKNNNIACYKVSSLKHFYKNKLASHYNTPDKLLYKDLSDMHSPLLVMQADISDANWPIYSTDWYGFGVNYDSFDNYIFDVDDAEDRVWLELNTIVKKYSTTYNNDADSFALNDIETIMQDLDEAKADAFNPLDPQKSAQRMNKLPQSLV